MAGRKTFVRADAFEVSRATAAAICSSVAAVGKLSFASACSRVICALHIDEMNAQAREHTQYMLIRRFIIRHPKLDMRMYRA